MDAGVGREKLFCSFMNPGCKLKQQFGDVGTGRHQNK